MPEPRIDAAAESCETGLPAAIATLRDLLAQGVVLTSDLLLEAVEQAVAYGRITREDAEGLVRNLAAVGGRQARDTLAVLEGAIARRSQQASALVRVRVANLAAGLAVARAWRGRPPRQ